jgi:hypothetical protein
VLQNQCVGEGFLEFPECQLGFSCPFPLSFLLCG